jgi:hypothetical protein
MHTIKIKSEVYEPDEFTFATFEEAMAALRHFSEEALRQCRIDGIEREVAYYATPQSMDTPQEIEVTPKLRV